MTGAPVWALIGLVRYCGNAAPVAGTGQAMVTSCAWGSVRRSPSAIGLTFFSH